MQTHPLDDELAQYMKQFTLRHGRIANPGIFEGEPCFTPYFYRLWTEGLEDLNDDAENVGSFLLGKDELVMFPELTGQSFVHVTILDNGHVCAWSSDPAELPV